MMSTAEASEREHQYVQGSWRRRPGGTSCQEPQRCGCVVRYHTYKITSPPPQINVYTGTILFKGALIDFWPQGGREHKLTNIQPLRFIIVIIIITCENGKAAGFSERRFMY